MFFAAFYLLWRNQPKLNYSLSAALGFLLSAAGFIVQDILPAWPYELHRIASNFGFLAGVCAFMAAPLQRRHIPIPVRSIILLIIATMTALFWFLTIQPNLAARIAIMSVSLVVPVAVTLILLLRVSDQRYSDRLILGVVWFTLLLSMLRPVVAFLLPQSFGNYTALEQSTYWGMVHFSYVMMSVTLAIVLFVAIALDLIDELHHQATTDSLSGLLNRRGFESAANSALTVSNPKRQFKALMIADLDHFKSINDSFGHAAGDQVIKSIARHIQVIAGDTAICGRIGGEEFAILLPDHDETMAADIAESIRRDFDSLTTISIGLVISEQPATLSSLLGVADKALYAAKKNGRNQVFILHHSLEDQEA
ncbi:GGDEF domain-containing protein [Pseudohongiella spirulinae]|uniref:GGDEF domain-containing protein n=1 Tax=Pseudohongiella spirulinae TaxID=1249552 RepID=UPI00071772C9|nr:GGDEF domain-containing protein [Pseudohongiella spirulinae]